MCIRDSSCKVNKLRTTSPHMKRFKVHSINCPYRTLPDGSPDVYVHLRHDPSYSDRKQRYDLRAFVYLMTVFVQNKLNTNPQNHKHVSSHQHLFHRNSGKTDISINQSTVDEFSKYAEGAHTTACTYHSTLGHRVVRLTR